jgi:cation diffusion facilitator family transporter
MTRDIRSIRMVLIGTMLLNFLSTAVKLGVGAWTGALSLTADGLDSFFDGVSNIIGLVGLQISARPPDENHPYGHRKYETLAALTIAFLLFFTCWQLLASAVERLRGGVTPVVTLWSFAALAFSLVVQGWTSVYEMRRGRALGSELLVADALHTRASMLISVSVAIGLTLARLGLAWADPAVAVLVAVAIARVGVDVLRQNLPALMDEAAVDPRQIADVVRRVPGVTSFHRIRSRGTSDATAVDLHVRVDPRQSVEEAGAIADEVRRRLLTMDGVADVTIHVEAQRQADASGDMVAVARQAAREVGVTIHEAWAHRLDDRLYLELHVGVDPRLTLGVAHQLADRLEQLCLTRLPDVAAIHTHIEPATTSVQTDIPVSDEWQARAEREVRQAVAAIDGLSEPHGIQARREPDGLFLSLACYVAPDLPLPAAHRLSSELEEELKARLGAADVLVHLEPRPA